MRFQLSALLAMVPLAIAQGVTDKVAPEGDAPAGCQPNTDGRFEITVVPLAEKAKRDSLLANRATCSGGGTVVVQLADGVLTDDQGRTGYIASNFQFQFDNPPQAGALYTAGFSACTNGSLALGSSATFWQCASGTFYNLYDRWSAAQCSPVDILILPCGSGGDNSNDQDATQTVIGTRIITTTLVVPLGDGQPQVITTTTLVPICQINDGQLQAHTTPCTPTQLTPTNRPPVSQISDGQVQVTPGPTGPVPTASFPGADNGGGGEETVPPIAEPVPVPVPTGAPPVGSGGGIVVVGWGGGAWVGVAVAGLVAVM